VEEVFERRIVTDEHQSRSGLPAFLEQQPDEGLASIRIQ
jgi:hypothetical protein